MSKLPFDSILDPQKIEAYVLINKMVKTLDNPDLNPVERELIVVALETLAKTYIELVDPTEN